MREETLHDKIETIVHASITNPANSTCPFVLSQQITDAIFTELEVFVNNVISKLREEQYNEENSRS